MKRFIHIAGALYVAFALVAAHTALVTTQELATGHPSSGSVVAIADKTLLDHQRLHLVDAQAEGDCDDCDDGCRTDKSCYAITLWTGDFCSACKVWKRNQAPALLKLGYKITYKDYHKDNPPEDDVKMLPTVCLVYKGVPIKYVINWSAKDLDEFVEARLKPITPDEVPDSIY